MKDGHIMVEPWRRHDRPKTYLSRLWFLHETRFAVDNDVRVGEDHVTRRGRSANQGRGQVIVACLTRVKARQDDVARIDRLKAGRQGLEGTRRQKKTTDKRCVNPIPGGI